MSRAQVELAAVRKGRIALGRVAAEHPELTSPRARERLSARLSQGGGALVTRRTARYRDETMATTTTERHAINLRLPSELMTAVKAAEEAIPALSRHAICLAALGIGLAALAEDPSLAMAQNIRGKAPAKKRSKRA